MNPRRRTVGPNVRARRRRHSPWAMLVAACLLTAAVATSAQEPAAVDACEEGLELARLGRHLEARERLADCLAAGDEPLMPLVAMTMMALEDDRVVEALDWSGRAAAAHPDDAEALFWNGLALDAAGDRDGARDRWQAGLQRDMEHGPTLRNLARYALDDGEEQAANGLLIQLVRVEGGDPWSLRTLSELALKRALWKQSLAHWDAALKLGPRTGADVRKACELAILAGDTTYALEAGREAVALEPASASWETMGEAYYAARRFEASVPAFRQALELDAGASRARFNLANALELLGRTEEASAEYERYILEAPEDPRGFLNYSLHLDKTGRSDEALVQVRQAALLRPGSPEPLHLQARILEKLGRDEQLLAVLDELAALDVSGLADLEAWRERVRGRLDLATVRAGQMRLLHIATPDSTAQRLIREDMLAGLDFSVLATRYSVAPTAAQGGDVGWVDPESMSEDFRPALRGLRIDQTTPFVRSGGLYHIFKRIR